MTRVKTTICLLSRIVGHAAYAYLGYIVYQASSNEIVRQGLGPIDECQIDKTGRFLVWKTGVEGVGKIEVKILDIETGAVIDLTDDSPDHAPGLITVAVLLWVRPISPIPLRVEIWQHRRNSPKSSSYRTHGTTDSTSPCSPSTKAGAWSDLWRGKARQAQQVSFVEELVQVARDGSKRVRRLAHHHSVYRGQYYDTPRANTSRDGRFIAFTSNSGTPQGHRDLFIAHIAPAPQH